MADYNKLTVVKLRDELKSRGLAATGLKAALVARLEEDDAAPVAEAAPESNIAAEDLPSEEAGASDPTEPNAPVPEATATEQPAENPETEPTPAERETKDEVLPPADNEQPQASNQLADQLPDHHTREPEEQLRSPIQEESKEEQISREDTKQEEQADTMEVAEEQENSQNANKDAPDILQADQAHASPDVKDIAVDTLAGSQALGTPISDRASQQPESIRAIETYQLGTQNSIGPEEFAEDKRKRKRRSQSPIPSTQDAALKRLKAQDGSPRARTIDDDSHPHSMDVPMTESSTVQEPEPEERIKHSPADARFKGLFATQASTQPSHPPEEPVQDRDVAPALHPATSALYIRNLQRPLQPNVLREHLAAISQPSNAPSSNAIEEFYLDPIRSHCLVQFTSTSAASRVRLALHDTVWPKERDRRPLWVDFLPEEKIKKFIDVEQESAGSRPPKRWEVSYEEEDETMVVHLREADLLSQRRQKPLVGHNGAPAPTNVRPVVPKGDPGRGFKALDDLFKSTVSKPKLYFQPVSNTVVDHRLDLLAQGRGGGRNDEMRRFSFEDGTIVDKGPEWGLGGRGPRGGHRGGFEGRGGYRGENWRGGR